MKKTLFTLISMMSITCSFAQNTPWATTGNIGIGTTTPSYPLDVSGIIRATGNIITPSVNNQYIGYGANGEVKSLAFGTNVLGGSSGNTGINNVALGSNVLNFNTTGSYNVGIGYNTLSKNTTGVGNLGIGFIALLNNTTGVGNVAIGRATLGNNIEGTLSVAIGAQALLSNNGAGLNTAVGYQSGYSSTTGTQNTFLGLYSGSTLTTGSNNTILGSSPTQTSLGITTGSNNTIIGANITGLPPTLTNHIILADGQGQQRLIINEAGNTGIGTATPSVKLEVAGSILYGGQVANLDPLAGPIDFLANSGQCLIGWNRTAGGGETDFMSNQGTGHYGGFAFYNYNNDGLQTELIKFRGDGNVGIGMTSPDEKLAVNGTVHSKEVKVDLNNWPDYVFKIDYDLMELSDVKTYVNENHHLPNIPSAVEVAKNGLKLGEMNSKLLQKVEELTLYMIDKDQQVKDQQVQIKDQQNQIKCQQDQINALVENQHTQILGQKNEIELLKQQFKSLADSLKKSNKF